MVEWLVGVCSHVVVIRSSIRGCGSNAIVVVIGVIEGGRERGQNSQSMKQ